MDLTLTDRELELICQALQRFESAEAEGALNAEQLKELRSLYQRLQTLHTAK